MLCPFFDQHNSREIKCEGVMDDCMHIMAFRESAAKTWYMDTYCKKEYKKCEYCRILMQEKYEAE